MNEQFLTDHAPRGTSRTVGDILGDSLERLNKIMEGLVMTAEQEAEWERRKAEEEAGRIEEFRKLRLTNAGFGTREIRAARDAGGEFWLERLSVVQEQLKRGNSVFLLGDCGSGKTVMACRVADEWEKKVRYVTAPDFFVGVQKTWRKDAEMSQEAYLLPFERASLLIVDEFQDKSNDEWVNRIITSLVDHRYKFELPTLLISNQDYEGTRKMTTRSIFSRTEEAGAFVELGDYSFRTRR